jgi:hypothetical protein
MMPGSPQRGIRQLMTEYIILAKSSSTATGFLDVVGSVLTVSLPQKLTTSVFGAMD